MINPNIFMGGEDDREFVEINGSFFCDKCGDTPTVGKMYLDNNVIEWECSCGKNEAGL